MPIGTYYLNDPNAPKPNAPVRIGTNAYIEWNGRLLLEQRWDCGAWGLIGGRLKNSETYAEGIAREVREETGIYLPPSAFTQIKICDDDRIAAYQDGTVWRMIIVLFRVVLDQEPKLKCSRESGALRFFAPGELTDLPVPPTHADLIREWAEQQQNCILL